MKGGRGRINATPKINSLGAERFMSAGLFKGMGENGEGKKPFLSCADGGDTLAEGE